MKFSIITICRNSEKVLPQAMASLAAQCYKDYEWVVIDGASTDSTLKIAQSFSAAPMLLISEPDDGIYSAMNKGVANARGDYLFFLNSDDSLNDCEVLADVVKELDADPLIDLLYGDVIYKREGSRVLRTFAHIDAHTLPFEDLCHQAVFARKSLFERIGRFNEQFKINADYDWLIRVFRSGARLYRISRTIAVFNVGGAHTQNPAQVAEERREVRLQYLSPAALSLGSLHRKLIHRWHRHFRAHPLGRQLIKD
ncbi:MAG: glycosyltransferase [Pseudomonadota bacterium]|nr:glycosyltransferase [Pseudomonadota bacterium]